MSVRIVIITILFAISAAVYAEEDRSDKDLLIKEVLELSGVSAQIDNIPDLINMDLVQSVEVLSTAQREQLHNIIAEAFRAEVIYQSIADSYRENFDHQRFTTLLTMLRSPLARRMASYERLSHSNNLSEDLEQFIENFFAHHPNPTRITLVSNLINAFGTTDTALELQLTTIREVAKAVDPLLPPHRQHKGEELDHMLRDVRSDLEPTIRDLSLLVGLYVYAQATDGEIEQYTDLYETEVGRWAAELKRRAMVEALSAAARTAGKRIQQVIVNAQAI